MATQRTIILIHNTRPQAYGGAESYQLKLSETLSGLSCRPLIITSSRRLLSQARSAKILAISAPFCRIQNWSGWRNLLFPLYILWQLRLYFWYSSVFKKFHPFAVNIQSRDDFLAATWAARRHHAKVFWTDHADFRTWILVNAKIKYKNFIGKWILHTARKVDRLIFISDFERRYFEDLISPRHFSNLLTIKNGVPDHFAEYKNIKPSPQSFCYLGRLVEEKGIKELLSSFKKVHTTHPQAVLNIYGDGDDALVSRAQKTPGVVYHGFTEDPLNAIASSAIFILPSYHEGLSLSLLEATMLGRAIIATNVDGNPEVITDQDTGLLVPPRNTAALATAMESLLQDPKLRTRLAANARRHYRDNFNFSRIIQRDFLPLLEDDHA